MERVLASLPIADGPGLALLVQGGAALWAIAVLSVILVALSLWKLWRLFVMGAFSSARAERAIGLWQSGDGGGAVAAIEGRRTLRARLLRAAFAAVRDLPEQAAREEVTRVAKRELAEVRMGLRALELIALIAPLLGLLGTVLGMIAAFRQLQEAGGTADPAALAGGIWEALLTTAAGMAVAIPASIGLSCFEGLADRLRLDLEDLATRVFTARGSAGGGLARAAE